MMENKTTGYPSIDKPWLKFYSDSDTKMPLPESTLYDYIKECNSNNLERVCLNYYGNNITYDSFFSEIEKIASSLEQCGVKSGDIVSVIMINSPETIFLMFALNKIGAVANMIYGADPSNEICKHIVDANSRILFVLDIFQEKVLEIVNQTQIEKVIVANLLQGMSFIYKVGAKIKKKVVVKRIPKDRRFITWKQFIKLNTGYSNSKHDPNAPAFITYTGGTTGGSKGVLLSNKAVLAVSHQYIIGHQNINREKLLFRDSKWTQVLPLFIAYGIISLIIPLEVGMTLIVRIPMGDSIAELCKKFKPNHIIYGPAFWEAFADDNIDLDLSYFIAPTTGGDTLPKKVEDKINSYLKRCGSQYPLMNGYGMTEVGAAVSVNHIYAYEIGSVGTPFIKNIVSAFDVETGKELTYGQEGEICIHTPSMMIGYLNNQEETELIIRKHEDGLLWVHSGDLGYISESGFIYISGRLKRYMLTIANGIQKKIFSLDIEKVLLRHPEVEKCAVVPIDDEKYNQVPIAYIVPQNKSTNSSLMENKLFKFADENLEPLYRPLKYYITSRFPLTKVGKVDYKKLEEMASQEA